MKLFRKINPGILAVIIALSSIAISERSIAIGNPGGGNAGLGGGQGTGSNRGGAGGAGMNNPGGGNSGLNSSGVGSDRELDTRGNPDVEMHNAGGGATGLSNGRD